MKTLLFSIIIVLTVSCNKTGGESTQQTDSDKELYEELSVSQETIEIKGKKLYSKFNVTEYCNPEDQDSVMFYMEKFGTKTVFNISVEPVNNQLKIRYWIIDDCCLKFRGQASLDSMKLNLYHLKKAGNPCECKCMYEFEFLFRQTDKPAQLFINNKETLF